MLSLTLLFVVCGLVIVALGIPLARRRVKPNGLYGLRVPATAEDEDVWYEANALSGRDLIVLGFAIAVLALALRAVPTWTEDGYGRALAVALVVGALVVAAIGWRRANRLLADKRGGVG